MKSVVNLMIMLVVLVGMILFSSWKTMAATMPSGEFAGIITDKGSVNNATYQTGGVGIEERAAMLKNMKDYNLRLTFATTKGLYLAAIPVQIKTLNGKVILSKESDGPWFWANIPPGQYEVMASYKNTKQVLKVDVGMTPQGVEFAWK